MSFLLRGLTSFLPKIGGILGNVFQGGKSLLSNIFSRGSSIASKVADVASNVGDKFNRIVDTGRNFYNNVKGYIPQVGNTIKNVGNALGRAGDASTEFGRGNQSPNDYTNSMRGIYNDTRPDVSNTIDGGRDLFNNGAQSAREVKNVFQRDN